MTQQLSTHLNKTGVDPLNLCKDEWRISQRLIYSGDLTVLHEVQPPDELEVCRYTHHTLFFSLMDSPKRVTRIVEQAYEGSMNAGELFLVPAGCPTFQAWETNDEAIIFLFTPDLLLRTAAQTEALNPDQIELRPVLIDQDSQIEKIARLFHSEMQTEGLGDRLYSESLANCLAIHLLRQYSATPAKLRSYDRGLSREQLQRTIDYIQAHLDEKITLEAIAQHLNLSVYYFCELFTLSTGMPPYRYVLSQRVERAKQLLKNQRELSLTQVALDCGFANQSHFTKHFRKFTGITPKGYRKQF